MILIQEPRLSVSTPCSYISDKMWRFEYFFAMGLDKNDLDELLASGWRKFGIYYFRPKCEDCYQCIPLRVAVNEFVVSKSMRRIVNRCSDVSVTFGPLKYRDEIFDIYVDHSINRFNKESDREDFVETFYTESCSSMQSEYYLDGELIGVGFLDVSTDAMSSVYFIFRTRYEDLSPGTFSVIKEIEYARAMKLKYYYLGYYIKENRSMAYKHRFHPHEQYDWIKGKWKSES